jgi:L-ascorbate metabolism protein UlaG (beta-lactamase superfamily)
VLLLAVPTPRVPRRGVLTAGVINADTGPVSPASERSTDSGRVPHPRCDLQFLGHSTVRVELAGTTVLTDPLLTTRLGPLRRVVAPLLPSSWAGVDLVLISHLHNDHLHLRSLRMLGRSMPIVVPRGAGRWLTRHGFTAVEELGPGQRLDAGGVSITATPADHAAHRWGPKLTHGPHAPAVGHLISDGATTVYAAGDTDLFPGMTDLGTAGIDVALLPVWGWGPSLGPGHLDPAGAAAAVQRLRPRVAVPVHWGTFAVAGLTSLRSPWRARMRRLLHEPPRRFAAGVAALADAGGVPAEVALTPPGSPVVLPCPSPGAA